MTAYKYVSPDIDAQINWATVGQTIASNFKAEADAREQKKEAIDQATRDMLKTLSVPPQGQDETKSQQAIKYGQDMSSFILTQQKLLKSGQIDPKTYMLTIQNATDSTSQMYDAFKSYQDNYKEIMDRSNSNASQPLELFLASKGEQFRDFNLFQPVINSDGSVSMAKKIKTMVDGKEVVTISTDPNDIMPVNYINSTFTSRFDRFNSIDKAKELASGLATYVRTSLKSPSLSGIGLIKAVESAKNNPDYKKAIDNLARSQMQGLNMLSYLTVDMSVDPTKPQYNIVDNPAEAAKSPYNILVQREGGRWVPKFTKEQEEAALSSFKTSIESYVGSKEQTQAIGQLSRNDTPEYLLNRQDKKQYSVDYGRNIGSLLTGNDNEVRAALATLNQNTGLIFSKNKNILTVTDTATKMTQTYDLNTMSPNDIGVKLLVATYKTADIDQAAARSGLSSGIGKRALNLSGQYNPVPLDNTSAKINKTKRGSLDPITK